jgi:hypothetical protein
VVLDLGPYRELQKLKKTCTKPRTVHVVNQKNYDLDRVLQNNIEIGNLRFWYPLLEK